MERSAFWCETVRVAPGVELDDRVRARAEVDDLADDAGRDAHVAGRRVGASASACMQQLLGADHERAGLTEHLLARPAPSSRFEVPTKPATKADAGLLVELDRCRELLDAALVEDRDAVAHRERLLLVVGDEDEGDADVALDLLELDLHLAAQLEVEGAERLVEQQHLRAG